MPPSNSQVPRIELNGDGTVLKLKIEVYGFDAGTPVEVSGQAIQANGAIATFYSVQEMPEHEKGEGADIWVTSNPVVPPKKFDVQFPITVVARATVAWITMLETDKDTPKVPSTTGTGSSGAWASNDDEVSWAVAPTQAPTVPPPATPLRHGTWWDRVKRQPLDTAMEGRFTRLFPYLPGARFDPDDLGLLADAMIAPAEEDDAKDTERDPEENPGIPAAYTYLGQFVDHDLTFDPISHLRETLNKSQLRELVDFRTPRFDLDSLYGRGPDDQPYLYSGDLLHLQLGEPMRGSAFDPGAVQLPRGPNGRALIGDPRNDENRIVAQLHAVFLRFHNAVVDRLGGSGHVSFADARQQVRWHYQWVLVTDFLPRILHGPTCQSVFPDPCRAVPALPWLRERDLDLMPVEFSVAAYRFGHSMVRPRYRLNQALPDQVPIFSGATADTADLGGFRPVPDSFAIDWRFFLDLEPGGNGASGIDPQLSYKIDTSLVNPLGALPARIAFDPSSLALRNLLRGSAFQLPSGQRVAEALGLPPLADEELLIGKAVDGSDAKPITQVAPGFAGNAPLWAYVLAEARATSWREAPAGQPRNDIPVRLGPVGGGLVAEVFASLLRGDPASYLYAEPLFRPIAEFTRDGKFGLAELINAALGRIP